VQLVAVGQQAGHDHANGGGQFGSDPTPGAQHQHREQRDFAGDPRVFVAALPVSGADDHGQAPGDQPEQQAATDLLRDVTQ